MRGTAILTLLLLWSSANADQHGSLFLAKAGLSPTEPEDLDRSAEKIKALFHYIEQNP